MSDEIDIEEHDVLENPSLKRIFPDLSVIKKEISQYEEGLDVGIDGATQDSVVVPTHAAEPTVPQSIDLPSNIVPKPEDPDISQNTSENHRLEVHLRFKTFLDSLADDIFENIELDSDTPPSPVHRNLKRPSSQNLHAVVKTKQKETKRLKNNILILGSKPSVQHPKKTTTLKKQVKIVLKNVSLFLNESKQYCKHCLILFPNINAFSCHMIKVHSPETSSSETKQKNKVTLKLLPKNKFKCEICNLLVSSKGNLARHIRRIHKQTNKSHNIFQAKTSLKQSAKRNQTKKHLKDIKMNESTKSVSRVTKSNSSESHTCFHCPQVFETRSSLIEHLYNVINPNSMPNQESDHTVRSGQTKKQDTIIDEDMNTDDLITFKDIECSECRIKFSTQSKLDQHYKRKHLNTKPTLNNKNYGSINLQTTTSRHLSLTKSKNVANLNFASNKHNESIETSMQKSTDQGLNKTEIIPNITNVNKPRQNTTKEQNEYVENHNSDSDINNHCSPDHNSATDSASDSEPNSNTKKSSVRFKCVLGQRKQLYQCFICSQYMTYFKWYSRHMRGHNIKGSSEGDKTVFDPKCKFCSIKFTSIKIYNKHVINTHYEKTVRKMKRDNKVFQSIVFKCVKCDVYFLSISAANNHHEHKEMFINWRCIDCQKMFKIKDKPLHTKQHILSKNISAYDLSESALTQVLFKCLKCAIHFSEKEYFHHYTTCDSEIPNSAYCNTCDILINANDIAFHEHRHKDKSLQSSDFTFIESDIIINKVKKKKDGNKNPYAGSEFTLTFCHTCNCFIRNLGNKDITHIQKRCGVIVPRMCYKCGLIFTNRGYVSHKLLHDRVENLSLQTFNFYDIVSKKQIRPPIPQYPECNICQVHFLNKTAFRKHVCSQQTYTICNICNIKLTEAAFKFHIKFHKYTLTFCALNKEQSAKLQHSNHNNNHGPDSSSLAIVAKQAVSIENQISDNSGKNDGKENTFLYTCISCNITFDLYDKVIEHCHDHYDYFKPIKTSGHKETQSNGQCDDNFVTKITFDPFYFRFANDVWLKHIFVDLDDKTVKNILKHSIYRFEVRLKMEQIQSGPFNLVLYKCDICRSYVEPNALYIHMTNPCAKAKKHPCTICGLCFYTPSHRVIHEKLHIVRPDLNIMSYMIIIYNKIEHQEFTKMIFEAHNKFIMYECRNCECIVDKLQQMIHKCHNAEITKCSHCGLLFYDQEFNSHVNKHKEFMYFRPEHMILIRFGKSRSENNNKLKPSFSGTIHDLTFYKCIDCGLCLKSNQDISKHICVSKSRKSRCPKCYLCFLKKDIYEHSHLHERNVELSYDDFNSNIISFNPPYLIENTNNAVEIEVACYSNANKHKNKETKTNEKDSNKNDHETNIKDKETNRIEKEISGSETETNKIEIKTCQQETNIKETEKNTNETNGKETHTNEKETNINETIDPNISQKIYKCGCGLHFLEDSNARKHSISCNPKQKISRQNCFKCNLLFTPGELFNHLLKHHGNKNMQFKYDIINMKEE